MSKTRYWDIFIHTNMFVIWTHISLDSPVTIIRRKFAQSILKVIHSSVEGQPSWKYILKKKIEKITNFYTKFIVLLTIMENEEAKLA